MVQAYLRHLGVQPEVEVLPPHLFPQWGFSLLGSLVGGLPYPMWRAVNAGCDLRVRTPIPLSEPLVVEGRVLRVDENERRVEVALGLNTSSPSAPNALEAEIRLRLRKVRPRPRAPDRGAERTSRGDPNPSAASPEGRPRSSGVIPHDIPLAGPVDVAREDGLAFAKLTGDFNPLHWSRLYARRLGFPDVVLHGFSTMARSWVTIEASRGRPVTDWSCRFEKALVLPARVGIFVHEQQVYVGSGPGAPVLLRGRYS